MTEELERVLEEVVDYPMARTIARHLRAHFAGKTIDEVIAALGLR